MGQISYKRKKSWSNPLYHGGGATCVVDDGKSSIFSVNSVVIYGEVFPKIVDFLSISDFVGGICILGAKSRLYIGFLDHSKMQFISLQELYLTK
jgi:hypothetical protein